MNDTLGHTQTASFTVIVQPVEDENGYVPIEAILLGIAAAAVIGIVAVIGLLYRRRKHRKTRG
ncbi:MAG: hypothetical protein ACXADB_14550 [Candidatus Hermodarchaeia archaeon]